MPPITPKAGLLRVLHQPGFDTVTFVFIATNGPFKGRDPFDRYPTQAQIAAAHREADTWDGGDEQVLAMAAQILEAEGWELDRDWREVKVDKPPLTAPPVGTLPVRQSTERATVAKPAVNVD